MNVLFSMLQAGRGVHNFSFQLQLHFQIVFTYVLTISEYLAGQMLLLSMEFMGCVQPPIHLTASSKVFVREIWYAVQRFRTRDIEILSLKCIDRITDFVRLQGSEWQLAALIIGQCAQPVWEQVQILEERPLQSATATRFMCTKLYVRAMKSLDYRQMAPLIGDVLKHLIFIFQYVDHRGPAHTLQELRLGVAMFSKLRFDMQRTLFVLHEQKFAQLQQVFANFCARLESDLPYLGTTAISVCAELGCYLMKSTRERNSEASKHFLMLCVRMSGRRLSLTQLQKIYRLFMASACENSLCQVQEHIGIFLANILANRYV